MSFPVVAMTPKNRTKGTLGSREELVPYSDNMLGDLNVLQQS